MEKKGHLINLASEKHKETNEVDRTVIYIEREKKREAKVSTKIIILIVLTGILLTILFKIILENTIIDIGVWSQQNIFWGAIESQLFSPKNYS